MVSLCSWYPLFALNIIIYPSEYFNCYTKMILKQILELVDYLFQDYKDGLKVIFSSLWLIQLQSQLGYTNFKEHCCSGIPSRSHQSLVRFFSALFFVISYW